MAKKTFKPTVQETTSPASAFISQPAELTATAATEGNEERKSVRINLLFRPSTKRNIEKLAYLKHTSTNDFINTVLDEYIAAHAEDIAKYDSIFSE